MSMFSPSFWQRPIPQTEEKQNWFVNGYYNIPEADMFQKMSDSELRCRELESNPGSKRQLAFAEEIARRERWNARLWEVFLVVLGLAGQALLAYLHLMK